MALIVALDVAPEHGSTIRADRLAPATGPRGGPYPKRAHMGIGIGIVLIVVGAILLWAVQVNIPFVSDDTLGTILIVAGILAVILALVMNAQRTRTKHTQENRYEGPPPVV
jgi:hypothetical protein